MTLSAFGVICSARRRLTVRYLRPSRARRPPARSSGSTTQTFAADRRPRQATPRQQPEKPVSKNFGKSLILNWSRRADLNRGPADYESAALPTELRRLRTAAFQRITTVAGPVQKRRAWHLCAPMPGCSCQCASDRCLSCRDDTVNEQAGIDMPYMSDDQLRQLRRYAEGIAHSDSARRAESGR